METKNIVEPRDATKERITNYLKHNVSVSLKELRYDTGKATRYDSVLSIISELEKEGDVMIRKAGNTIITWIGIK